MKHSEFNRTQLYEIDTRKIIILNILSAGLYHFIWIYRTHKRISLIKQLPWSPGVFTYLAPYTCWILFFRIHALEFGPAHIFRYVFLLFGALYVAGNMMVVSLVVPVAQVPGCLILTAIIVVQNILVNNILRKRVRMLIREPAMSRTEWIFVTIGICVWLIVFSASFD